MYIIYFRIIISLVLSINNIKHIYLYLVVSHVYFILSYSSVCELKQLVPYKCVVAIVSTLGYGNVWST